MLPHFRFLAYRNTGGVLPPHIDLSRSELYYSYSQDGIRIQTEGHILNVASSRARSYLSPVSKRKVTSTHTFILYLSSCDHGGETALLKNLVAGCENIGKGKKGKRAKKKKEKERLDACHNQDDLEEANTLAAVKPVRGRMLFFPHACPHEGRLVECVPKLLIRGEMF